MNTTDMDRLVGFDTETTGVDQQDTIVEAAIVGPTTRTWVINTTRPVSANASALHGHTTLSLQTNGAHPDVALLEIVAELDRTWANGGIIVGMNLGFDFDRLATSLQTDAGLSGLRGLLEAPKFPIFDIMIADKFIDRWRKGPRKLSDLCTHYGVTNLAPHTSEGDARATVDIARKMFARYPAWSAITPSMLTRQVRQWRREQAEELTRYLATSKKSRFTGSTSPYGDIWEKGQDDV